MVLLGIASPMGLSPIAVLAGAIPVLLLLSKDDRAGAELAVTGSLAVTIWLVTAGQSLAVSLACALGVFWLPLGLARILKQTGSLVLVFQLSIVIAGVALSLVYAMVNDAAGQWDERIRAAAKLMNTDGAILDEQAVVDSLAASNWGTYAAVWLLTVLGSVFLGRWWQSLLHSPGQFGEEYRQIKLGVVLGFVLMGILVASFVVSKLGLDADVLNALLWIVVAAFVFQGLAAAHKLKARGAIGRGWLTTIYVVLIVPFSTSIGVLFLAVWGLADNWSGSRTNRV